MNQRRYGALLSYVSIALNLAIGFLFTPFLVHRLGQAEYGLYTIIGSFVGYLGIMDLGLTDSVVRYVARYRAVGDRASEENLLAFVFMLYGGICVLTVAAGLLILTHLGSIFGRSFTMQELGSARVMFALLLLNTTLTILFNSVTATIVAYERFVLLRTLEISLNLISTLAISAFLLLGYRAVAVVAVTTVVQLMGLLFKICYAFLKLGVRVRIHRLEWSFMSDVFGYAMSLFVVVVAEQIYWKLDNVILGIMLTPSIVAVYSIGMSFHKYFMSFSTAISKVMLPKIVRRVELGADGRELTDLLISVSRVQALVLMLVLTGLVVFGHEFIRLWIGPSYQLAYLVMLVTLLPYSLDLVGNIRNQIMQAKGIYWYRSITVLVVSLLNIGLTICLVRAIGMVGGAISTGVGVLIGYIAVNVVLARKAAIDIGRYHKQLAAGILPAALLSGAVGVASNLVPISSWPMLLAKIVVFTVVYIACIWCVGMNGYEKELVTALVPLRRLALRRRLAGGVS